MWQRSGKFVLQYRLPLLVVLFAATAIMGFYASKVKLSYEFAKAIPTDNPKYQAYQAFRERFGDDGNILVAGIKSDKFFDTAVFRAYTELHREIKKVKNVEDVISVPYAITLRRDTGTQKMLASKIFSDSLLSQDALNKAATVFYNLPFYRTIMYNPATKAWLMGVRINKDSLNSPVRSRIIADIYTAVKHFEERTAIPVHLSGLPLIRTVVADRIQQEMKFFLVGSLILSALILLLFFRSVSTMLISLSVVIIGVIWSVGILQLCGYKISLLTALIPSLVVVIGIPNCIYFINKYHTSYLNYASNLSLAHSPAPPETSTSLRTKALVAMVSKMGVVTLFCNITAAIGFAVFALTRSTILKEFGVVAGISIMVIFLISFILLPAVLSYLPSPSKSQTRYLSNRLVTNFLLRIEKWVFHHKKVIYITTILLLVFAIAGIFRLQTVAFIVDDLPKTDKIYTDLKFFETNFKGIMPLEIVIDTKKSNGLRRPGVFERIDSLSAYIASLPQTNRPLSLSEGFKFFYQAFSEGDSSSYVFPNEKLVEELLRKLKAGADSIPRDNLSRSLMSFMDSSRQRTRISISMADVGTKNLPALLSDIEEKAGQLFDTAHYHVELTGTSITFLEGSKFIINGLKESVCWAFLLIALCMLYLFRSVRILFCSLIPNLIPLVITAGVMGWVGVPLKPSTVLVFSVALGIAIDITIRFLVNYKQELPVFNSEVIPTVSATIKNTGLSIVYTSLVLTAGFIIFCWSSFGGTQALGWLTSLTLVVATLTNLVLLPVLLLLFSPKRNKTD